MSIGGLAERQGSERVENIMKLYTSPLSPNCRKVHAVAKFLNVELQQELVDITQGAQYEPSFLAINPNSKVPALADGETTLWESNAILGYLGAQTSTDAWPKTNQRYDILKWMNWEACHFAPAVAQLIGQYIFAPMRGGTPDEAIIDSALKDFRKYAAVANGQLESTAFLGSETPTLADFSVAVWLSYEHICKLPVAEFTHLQRWWTAVKALPGGSELLLPTPR